MPSEASCQNMANKQRLPRFLLLFVLSDCVPYLKLLSLLEIARAIVLLAFPASGGYPQSQPGGEITNDIHYSGLYHAKYLLVTEAQLEPNIALLQLGSLYWPGKIKPGWDYVIPAMRGEFGSFPEALRSRAKLTPRCNSDMPQNFFRSLSGINRASEII